MKIEDLLYHFSIFYGCTVQVELKTDIEHDGTVIKKAYLRHESGDILGHGESIDEAFISMLDLLLLSPHWQDEYFGVRKPIPPKSTERKESESPK